jgi:hypothetical protein
MLEKMQNMIIYLEITSLNQMYTSMKNKSEHFFKKKSLIIISYILCTNANAFFFFIPIPNLASPPKLQQIIDALEKSDETKAVASVSENKVFGTKQWIWGHIAGEMTQEEADKQALMICDRGLQQAKNEKVGGKSLYDFGSKQCELHKFKNKSLKLPASGKSKITSTEQQISTSKQEDDISAVIEKIKLFKFSPGWNNSPIPENLKNGGVFIFKLNNTIDSGVILSIVGKNQITDIKIYAQTNKNTLESSLDSPKSSGVSELTLADVKVIEYTVIGNLKTANKMQLKYLKYYLQTENNYIAITFWSGVTNFDFHRSEYDNNVINLIEFLKGKHNISMPPDDIKPNILNDNHEKCKSLGFLEKSEQYQLCIEELSK